MCLKRQSIAKVFVYYFINKFMYFEKSDFNENFEYINIIYRLYIEQFIFL